jgi:hypothetical protein
MVKSLVLGVMLSGVCWIGVILLFHLDLECLNRPGTAEILYSIFYFGWLISIYLSLVLFFALVTLFLIKRIIVRL